MQKREPKRCPYCGSEEVKQFGRCTQEECFYECTSCRMLSDLAVGVGYSYLKKKNCETNRILLKEQNNEEIDIKCVECGKPVGGERGTKGNYIDCKRVFAEEEQNLMGYLESEWIICFDCWKKIYYQVKD